MSHSALIAPITEWLIDRALGQNDVCELFDTLCRKISGIGIPVKRGRLIWSTLHPLFQAETVIWDRGHPATLEQFEHQDQASDAWSNSPLKYILENRLEIVRRRLTGDNKMLDFPLTEQLAEQGFTDFVVLATNLEGISFRLREGEQKDRGVMVTWATDKPEGFSDDDLAALQRIQRRFSVACKTVIQSRVSSNIAMTYLGKHAGTNVLNGQIRRGDGAKTKAVVWYSDLRNSTGLADTMEATRYFDLLNSFFMATAEPVVKNGGEILDFIGDAVLAIFPFEGDDELRSAACAANAALVEALQISDEANSERERNGDERYKFGIGLNIGEVMFGNIGIPSRLTFSVIGPTVNEVARIESMTKLLQQNVLANSTFAELDPSKWKSVGEHKLNGVLEPMELFSFQRAE